jgi:hypothetical protein
MYNGWLTMTWDRRGEPTTNDSWQSHERTKHHFRYVRIRYHIIGKFGEYLLHCYMISCSKSNLVQTYPAICCHYLTSSRCRGLQRKNRHVNGLSHLRNLDELAHGRHTVNEDVDYIRTRRCDGLVRGHLNGNGLAGAAGLEALGVEPYHAVTHVNRVGDESTIVEVDLDSLGVGRSSELDGESGAIGNWR